MSDVVDRTDRFQFARWLLEGIATHGNEIGLLRLLHSYVRGPIEDTEREKLLIACSKTVHETVFFALTEPLWRGLLGCGSFAKFESTLRQCEANLKGFSIDGRLAFYLQILKPAIWVANEAWVAESMNFIERNFERIPPFLEYDLEMVARLSEYRKHRAVFAEGHPLLQKLDRGLRDYFSEEQQVGDRSIVECQVQILTNKEALGAAFDPAGNPAYGVFLAIWAWISHDVAERNTDPAEQSIDEELWYGRSQTLLTQLAQQTRSSKLGMRWGVATITFRVSQVALLPMHSDVSAFCFPSSCHSSQTGRGAGGVWRDSSDHRGFFSRSLVTTEGKNKVLASLLPADVGPVLPPDLAARGPRLSRRAAHLPYRALVAYISHAAKDTISYSQWVKPTSATTLRFRCIQSRNDS